MISLFFINSHRTLGNSDDVNGLWLRKSPSFVEVAVLGNKARRELGSTASLELLRHNPSSIAGKAHRMGLPKRPSPISKPKVDTANTELVVEEQGLPLRLELRQLIWSRNKCCWPTGDPKKNGFLFCSDTVVPGKPYCLTHCQEAYTNSRDSG